MTEARKHGATYADLVDLPENVVGEIIDGTLYVTPRPRFAHGAVAVVVMGLISTNFDGDLRRKDGWWIVDEPELRFGEVAVVPDIAGWRRERMPKVPADAAFMTLAPDWLCEILSPSTARHDRARKLPVYAQAGVVHAWLIDPAAQTVEVYRLDDGRWTLAAAHGGDDRVNLEPFAELTIDLGAWWVPTD